MANQNKIIAIFGRKGSGKSTLFKAVLRRSRRLIVIDTLGEHDIGRVVYDRADLLEIVTSTEYFRVCYRPLDVDDVDWACYLAENIGDLTFAVDEVDNFTNSNFMSNGFRRLIHYGRHYNVSIVMASRQANRIRNDITAQADIIISFQQQGRQVLSYMADFNDNNVIGELLTMEKHKYISILGNFSLDIINDLP
jgi:hypothetical protein